jgi:betaine-aldehyde dehydrogenase
VSFTGSIETGRKVGMAAADGVKKAVMELGGNSPVIVFEDADLESALDAIELGGLYNTGQECMAASRLIIHSSIAERVVDGLRERCAKEVIGDVLDPDTTVGPMNSPQQRDRVLAKIAARSPESRIVAGGGVDRNGFFLEPTIIVGVSQGRRARPGGDLRTRLFDTEERPCRWPTAPATASHHRCSPRTSAALRASRTR